MHLTEPNPNSAQDLAQLTQNTEQLQHQLKEVQAVLNIILTRLNEQYLSELEKTNQIKPKQYHKPLTDYEKEEIDFNPLAYLEHKGLLKLSEYESDRDFIEVVIENYTRLGLLEFKTCIHNINARVHDLTKQPINNMRAYIKSSLIKHKAKK